MIRTTLIVCALSLFSVSAFADIRPPATPAPQPSDEMSARMFIDLRSDAKVPTLKIRREALKQLRAAIDEADDGQNALAATGSGSDISRTQTIVSGMLFSLAFVFGGVWLFRNKGTASKTAVSIVVAGVLGVGAVVVFANSPPPTVVALTTSIFDKQTRTYGYARDNIKIQILDRKPGVYTGLDNTDVILEVPKGADDKGSE